MAASRRRVWIVRASISLAVIVALWLAVCYQIVQNPTVVEQPTRADAIVVLGPATAARTDTALALVRQGISHVLVLSNVAGNATAEALCAAPPPGATVICFVPRPGTTRGEAEYLKTLVSEHGWSNVAVVTARFHISRARLILKRCDGGRLQMVAAHESIGPLEWLYQYAYQSAGYVKAALHPAC